MKYIVSRKVSHNSMTEYVAAPPGYMRTADGIQKDGTSPYKSGYEMTFKPAMAFHFPYKRVAVKAANSLYGSVVEEVPR